MTLSDYDGVYSLWISTPGMGLNTTDDSRDGIAKYLARNPSTCFVAEKNAEIIGVILSGHDGRRGFIHHTAVKVSERSEGIGSTLVNHAMSALKQEGINKVALVCFEANAIGNTFWERMGFTVREDLVYRNKNINELVRVDTSQKNTI
jgi:ribosomal protein S18 acetylase RimI-like enzyme